jgi:uncharacterized protein (DUF1015 family)
MFTPFRGTMFTEDVAASTSPPYDMIDDVTPYRESSPHNIARLLLPETYDEAARLLEVWQRTEILRTDETPRFYLYTMRFRSPDGVDREARGVVGAMSVDRFGPDVLAHEETMPHTGADRLELLRSTQANLDLIIALSPSPALAGLLEPDGIPRCVVDRDGVQHALYDTHREIGRAVDAYPLAIADGHHRYTAALEYRASQATPGPWDSIMAFVTPAEGSGLDIRPIHRFFPTLDWAPPEHIFDVRPAPPTIPSSPGSITVVTGQGSWLLTPRPDPLAALPSPWQSAGTAIARELLYPTLGVEEGDAVFHQDPERLIARLERHPNGAVLLMAGVPEAAVSDAATSRVRFPRKTTLFMPKPLAGLVLRAFPNQSPA